MGDIDGYHLARLLSTRTFVKERIVMFLVSLLPVLPLVFLSK